MGEAREEVVKFRLTSEEKEILQKASELLNYGSVSAYVREAIMDIAKVAVSDASVEERRKVIEDTATAIADRAIYDKVFTHEAYFVPAEEEGKLKVVLRPKKKGNEEED